MALPTKVLVGTFAVAVTAVTALTCPPHIGPKGVRVHLPPSFENNTYHSSCAAPPTGWYFQPWSMFYAFIPQYAAFRNFQYDPTPIDPSKPAGLVNDLSSFQLPGNETIYTACGVDTPHPTFLAVLDYAGTGILEGAISKYSMLAWGCDTHRAKYYASYSTAAELSGTPAGIDVMSTSDVGPDEATVGALAEALEKLGNAEISALVATLTKTTQDGRRKGLPMVNTYDDYCKSNEDLINIIS
ncbi:hypothetical protein EK21DRAFT_110898 [Setomelanomma holmii]|uniref:Uncharacterized protein n=1 Tax=Setomelanomma holmii TaxID=210430 RepID=A0A9P4HBG4_9PLEO|nr:hypothetical protein EK21DRAFT_110898 [Setomelanomma holmii]